MFAKMLRQHVLSCATFVALGVLANAEILAVDDSGGADFTDIQSAIGAASDGDTILVRPGNYADFLIEDKTLNVFAEPDTGLVNIVGTAFVSNLSKYKRVVLSGLKVTGRSLWPTSDQALVMNVNVGTIRVQNCTLKGGVGAPFVTCADDLPYGTGGLGADLFHCTDLAFAGCTITGGNGLGGGCLVAPGGHGGNGVDARTSQIALYDCTVRGGDGGDVLDGTAGNGGTAYHNPTGGFFASGTSFQGGAGGDTDYFTSPQAGDGGHGVFVGTNGNAHLLDNVYVGGVRGIAHFMGTNGQPGIGLTGTGYIEQLSGTRRKCTAQSVAAPGTIISVTILGQPGDQVFLPWSSRSFWRYRLLNKGTWLIPLPAWRTTTAIDVIPASGSLTTKLQLAPLPPGSDAALTSIQGFVIDTQGNTILGSPMHILRK